MEVGGRPSHPKTCNFFVLYQSPPPTPTKDLKKVITSHCVQTHPTKKVWKNLLPFPPTTNILNTSNAFPAFLLELLLVCAVWRGHRVFVFSCAIASVQGLIFPVTWTLHREVQQGQTVNHKGKQKRHSLPVHPCVFGTAILFMYFCCFFMSFCQFEMHAQCCFTYGCMLTFVPVAGTPSKPIKKMWMVHPFSPPQMEWVQSIL